MADSFTMDGNDNRGTESPTPSQPPPQLNPQQAMQQSVLVAVETHFVAKKARAVANINGYLTSSVGVAEHPDIVGEVIKLLKEIDEADGMVDTLRRISQQQ